MRSRRRLKPGQGDNFAFETSDAALGSWKKISQHPVPGAARPGRHRAGRRRDRDHEHHARGGRRADARDRDPEVARARGGATSWRSSSSSPPRCGASAPRSASASGSRSRSSSALTPLPAAVAPWSIVRRRGAGRRRRHRRRRLSGEPRGAARPDRRPEGRVTPPRPITLLSRMAEGVGIALDSIRANKVRAAPHDPGRGRRRVRGGRDGGRPSPGSTAASPAISRRPGPRRSSCSATSTAVSTVCDGSDELSPWRRKPWVTIDEAE